MNAIAESSNPTTEVEQPQQAYPKGRWTVFKNPFQKEKQKSEPVCAVQSEMSLETIIPIRNDLRETDPELFELSKAVRPQIQTKSEMKTDPFSEDKIIKPGAVWGKIVRGIFGSRD